MRIFKCTKIRVRIRIGVKITYIGVVDVGIRVQGWVRYLAPEMMYVEPVCGVEPE